MKGWRPYRRWILAGLAAIICGLLQVEGCYPSSLAQGDLSTTAITAAVHDWASYPAMQSVPAHYLPTAQWVGRLILPDQTAAAADPKDWVWMEIFNSPDSTLIGQRVKLQWQDSAEIQIYLDLVTRSIEFTEDTLESMALGRIHPTRLNGWAQVGPLQSLAGTRPQDDMIVALPQAAVSSDGQTVTINDIPIQVPERFYGLVKILGPDNRRPPAATCPDRPCESDYLRVQHYDLASQGFDGAIETVYIPQVPADSNGIFQSTSQGLAQSPAGEAGWYLYGAQNNEGVFVVRAIAPRRLFQLQPHTTVIDQAEALNYINFVNWRNTPAQKGTLQSVLLAPNQGQNSDPDLDSDLDPELVQAPATWQEGDRALVVHLFGGIGGEQAESRLIIGTTSGHYAYGMGEVIRDPFTQTLRLQIIYDQIYAHNPLGIVSGRGLWAEFAGNLRRGWLGIRPMSDVLIRLPVLDREYQLGAVDLTPFTAFQRQLAVMMARYRTGDGSGAAIVTPAQSCVQDSNQALYETIEVIKTQIGNDPTVQQWLAAHPEDSDTLSFRQLVALGDTIEQTLIPLGIARPDWQANADVLAGIQTDRRLNNFSNLGNGLLSWRTVMPRVAYDDIASIFLNQGAELWFLRTNQIGGQNPTIAPLAPTELFGDYVVIPTLFSRLIEASRKPKWTDLGAIALGLLFIWIALRLGDLGGNLGSNLGGDRSRSPLSPKRFGLRAVGALLTPALIQELIFRVLILPHPTEGVLPIKTLFWSLGSLAIFVAYQLWTAPIRLSTERRSPWQRRYFYISLGAITTVIYLTSGSLWATAGVHWGAWIMQNRPSVRQIKHQLQRSH